MERLKEVFHFVWDSGIVVHDLDSYTFLRKGLVRNSNRALRK
ncbi:hypothetical protein MKY70_09885 [Bacillus sp. FSL R9-9492]